MLLLSNRRLNLRSVISSKKWLPIRHHLGLGLDDELIYIQVTNDDFPVGILRCGISISPSGCAIEAGMHFL